MYGLIGVFLLTCVSSTIGVVDTSGTDRYAISNLLSPEAKDAVNKLQHYLDELDEKVEKYMKHLKEDNSVLEALEKYRATYKSSKKAECFTESLDVYNTCEERVKTFVDKCDGELPLDNLAEFYSQIEVAKGKVKEIDSVLKQNTEIYKTLPDLCEKIRINLVEEIEKVLSSEKRVELSTASENVYKSIQENLEQCFQSTSKSLREELADTNRLMTDCLNKN